MEQGKGKENVDPTASARQDIFEPMNISTDSLELSRNLPQVIDTNSETSNSFLVDRSIGPALVGTASSVDSPALGDPKRDSDAKDSLTPTGLPDRQALGDNRDSIVGDADGGLNRSIGPVLLGTAPSTESPAMGGPMREDGDAKGSTTPTGLPDRQSLIDNRETVEYADGLARELLNSTQGLEEILTSQSAAMGEEKVEEEEQYEVEEMAEEEKDTQRGEVDIKDESKEPEQLEKENLSVEQGEIVEEEEIQSEDVRRIGEEEKKPREEVEGRVERVEDNQQIKEEEEERVEEKILHFEEVEDIEEDKEEEVKAIVEEKEETEVEEEKEKEELESGDQEEIHHHHHQEEDDKIVEEIKDNSTAQDTVQEIHENYNPITDTQLDDSPPPPPTPVEPTPKIEEDTQQQDFHESSQTEAATAAAADNFLVDCEKLDEEMEFTKNYSDDLLMGQSDSGAQKGETMMASADLADFELPPYSGSSSGSEPQRQHSPVKRQSSSNSSAAQPTSSHQANAELSSSSPNLSAVKNLLMSSYCRISHVLHWKRPIETGIIFAIGVTLIITLTFFSIISVFAYSALGVILASALIRSYKAVTKALNRSSDLPFDHLWNKIQGLNVSLSPEKTHELVESSLGNLNASLLYFKQVLLFEDKIATFKSGLFLYMLTYIGAWFNGMTLITICYLALFSVPIFYEKNKTKIDEYLKLATGQLSSTISLVTNKATSLAFGGSSSPPTSGGASSKKQN